MYTSKHHFQSNIDAPSCNLLRLSKTNIAPLPDFFCGNFQIVHALHYKDSLFNLSHSKQNTEKVSIVS